MNLAPEIPYLGPPFPRCQPGNGGHQLYRLLDPDEIRFIVQAREANNDDSFPIGATVGRRQWSRLQMHNLNLIMKYPLHVPSEQEFEVEIKGMTFRVVGWTDDYFEWRY